MDCKGKARLTVERMSLARLKMVDSVQLWMNTGRTVCKRKTENGYDTPWEFFCRCPGGFEEVEDASEQMIEAEVVHATTSQEDLC